LEWSVTPKGLLEGDGSMTRTALRLALVLGLFTLATVVGLALPVVDQGVTAQEVVDGSRP
jgi:hypothetical protein